MPSIDLRIAVSSVVACLPSLGLAQPIFLRYQLTGEESFDLLNSPLAALGDVDGDGVSDFALGSRNGVKIVSARTGVVLMVLQSADDQAVFWPMTLAAPGDMDGDGITDLVVTGSSSASPAIFERRSGRTGELLGSLERLEDSAVALGAGDADGDGAADFAIWVIATTHSGLTVRSGRTGEVLWARSSEDPVERLFGSSVAPLGDLDGDGASDLAVGSARTHVAAPPQPGRVHILSGKDGRELSSLSGDAPADGFGSQVAALSDLDGDGISELAVASPTHPRVDRRGAGRVDLFDGASGRLLWSRTGNDPVLTPPCNDDTPCFQGDRLGEQIAAVGDTDGDGHGDLLVLARRASFDSLRGSVERSQVYLRSGKTGELLAVYDGERPDFAFGGSFAGLGDVDGDGRSEFALSAAERAFEEQPLGTVYVLSYVPESVRFLRGDANGDGRVDMSDAIRILSVLFLDGSPPSCAAALDVDRSLQVDVTDPVRILVNFFLGAELAPEPPFPECGRLFSLRGDLPCAATNCN